MLRTMTLVVPWRRMSSRASSMLPLPKAIRAMTADVPMMMPSTDRMERSLCSQRLRRARTNPLRHLTQIVRNPAKYESAMVVEPFQGSEEVARQRGNGGLVGRGHGEPERPQLRRGGGRGGRALVVAHVRLDVAVAH